MALKTGEAITTISTKEPVLGQKCIVVPDGQGGNIAIKPFNSYQSDEGVCMPLPCGSSAFVASEPPNYLPSSWESGFGLSCQQGYPSTDGWVCGPCPINTNYGYFCALGNGGVNIYNEGSCTHSQYSSIWRGNHNNNWRYKRTKWYCNPNCPAWRKKVYKNGQFQGYIYCPGAWTDTFVTTDRYGYTTGSYIPSAGCWQTSERFNGGDAYYDQNWQPARDFWNCYGNAVCPNYNSGRGVARCSIGPNPSFQPGPKPGGCRYQNYLEFSGWELSGGEQSTSTGCIFGKATEGVRSQSDGNIRCKFMSPVSTVGEVSGSGDARLPISPSNPNVFGKAGSQLTAQASISISGKVDYDYTRVPTRQSTRGNACVFTVGRY